MILQIRPVIGVVQIKGRIEPEGQIIGGIEQVLVGIQVRFFADRAAAIQTETEKRLLNASLHTAYKKKWIGQAGSAPSTKGRANVIWTVTK